MAHMAGARGRQFSLYRAISPNNRWNMAKRSCRWGRSLDGQGVNVGFEQVIDRGVYQAVARHRGHAAESLSDDPYPKMAVTSRGPGVAGMQVTLVLDDQQRGLEAALEA